ncbi:MAG: cyclic nucleotide-binding domain-containing protein [Chloroflexi bacterium]|nr:cyclic nucleotide-binding domain-containing protein [Chloroflexota bacterium]
MTTASAHPRAKYSPTSTLRALVKRTLALHSVPPRIIVLTALASYVGQLLAILQGWPLWAIVLATLLPWAPILFLETAWTYRHFQWLALFYILVVTQGGHFLEHLTQVTQIHVLGLRGADSRGVFGQLDIEWVHFTWNTWVLIAIVLLLVRFPRNGWLWITLLVAGWHEVEHAYIMSVYLTTGREGTPGLLSVRGAIAGGLPLIRPDLHFMYNVLETVPLVAAFGYQVRHSYDEWLAKALPHMSEEQMAETTNALETLRFAPGQAVVRQGEPADRFYIVTQGTVAVVREAEAGSEVHLATLGPGEFFGEIGLLMRSPRTATVRARTPVEVLAMHGGTFQGIMNSSQRTAQEVAQIAQQRLGQQLSPQDQRRT